jgi:hypothetical protein
MLLVQKVESQLVLMIKTPHTLHTHSRSTLYIYKVFQHLTLLLKVIRMQLQCKSYCVTTNTNMNNE